jgi:hypothetical protein
MSSQINTHEAILQINEKNDKTQNLGNEASLVQQNENGFDLLKHSQTIAYSFFEFFEKMFPESYRNEMSEYINASSEHDKDAVLNKYDQDNHIVNQPTKEILIVEKNYAKTLPCPIPVNYELMYKDDVCTFFIGSISVISLYIVFKLIERD